MPGPLVLAEAQRGVAGLEGGGEQAEGLGLFSLRGLGGVRVEPRRGRGGLFALLGRDRSHVPPVTLRRDDGVWPG